jgi:hypothetical protein
VTSRGGSLCAGALPVQDIEDGIAPVGASIRSRQVDVERAFLRELHEVEPQRFPRDDGLRLRSRRPVLIADILCVFVVDGSSGFDFNEIERAPDPEAESTPTGLFATLEKNQSGLEVVAEVR